MCDITMGLGLALSAVSAIAQQRASSEAASQQAAYQEAQMKAHNEAIKQSAQNALKEQVEQTTAERIQQMQEAQSAAREQQRHQTEYLQKKGTALASSPHGAGLSFDMLMDDYGRAYAVNTDVTREQLEMQGVGHDTSVRGYRDRAQSRLDSQQGYIPAPIENGGSNLLVNALGFTGDALGMYNAHTNYNLDSLFQSSTSRTVTASTKPWYKK